MIVVSNTTPLIGFAAIDRFALLQKLFSRIHIPQAVYDEAVVAGRDVGGAREQVSAADWITVVTVEDRLAVDVLLDELDLGEAETIVLARELDADWVPIDEKKGRRKLAEMQINKVGTVGLLLEAKRLGLVLALRPELERLRREGFSVSQPVVDTILRRAGELD